MSNPVTNNRALVAVLIGGLLFVIVAIGLVILLLSQPPAVQPVVILVTPTPPDPPPTSTPERETTPPPPPSPNPTSPPEPTSTPTLTPISAAGDKLALPTAIPRPSPTPTDTPAPTPTSPPPQPVSQPAEGLRIGDMAPDFTLGSNRASRVSLSGLRGKIVILNFWATWCPPCRHEVPDLQAIHNELGPQGVVVLAVNEREKLENVERFAHDNDIHFAVWLDEDGWAGEIYQVRAIPTTYFIDGEGIIRDIQIGTMRRDQIVSKLEKLL